MVSEGDTVSDRKTQRFLIGVGAIIVAGTLLAAGTASAQDASDDAPNSDAVVADVIWPPNASEGYQDVGALGASTLRAPNPAVLGDVPIETIKIQPTGKSSAEVRIRNADGSVVSINQSHNTSDLGNTSTMWVRPRDLSPLVEVTPGKSDNLVLQIVAPPGGFNVSADDPKARAHALTEKLQVPPPDPDRDEGLDEGWKGWRVETEAETDSSIYLYHGREVCVDAGASGCGSQPYILLDCSACTELIRTVHPAPTEEMQEAWDDEVQVGASSYNTMHVFLGPSDRLIAAQIPLMVDLNTSVLMDPAKARDLLKTQVRAKGYQVANEGPINEAGLQLAFNGSSLLTDARYHWTSFNAAKASAGNVSEGPLLASATQDAVTGNVTKLEVRSGHTGLAPDGGSAPGGGFSGPEQPIQGIPTTAVAAFVASIVVAATLWDRD